MATIETQMWCSTKLFQSVLRRGLDFIGIDHVAVCLLPPASHSNKGVIVKAPWIPQEQVHSMLSWNVGRQALANTQSF
jgi:hypothetical protein